MEKHRPISRLFAVTASRLFCVSSMLLVRHQLTGDGHTSTATKRGRKSEEGCNSLVREISKGQLVLTGAGKTVQRFSPAGMEQEDGTRRHVGFLPCQ
jgi:hypothetical protein